MTIITKNCKFELSHLIGPTVRIQLYKHNDNAIVDNDTKENIFIPIRAKLKRLYFFCLTFPSAFEEEGTWAALFVLLGRFILLVEG